MRLLKKHLSNCFHICMTLYHHAESRKYFATISWECFTFQCLFEPMFFNVLFFLFFLFLGIGTLRQDKKLEHTKETVKQSRVVGLSVIEVVSKSKISFWRRVASYFGQWPKNCVYCVRKFLFILFVC